MHKAVVYVGRTRKVEDFATKEQAIEFGQDGSEKGRHYFECVLDENDIIIIDKKELITDDDYKSEVGQKYNFENE